MYIIPMRRNLMTCKFYETSKTDAELKTKMNSIILLLVWLVVGDISSRVPILH